MGTVGLAEIALILIGALVVVTVACGLVAAFALPAHPVALLRARRVSVLRATCAIVSALVVFATAVIVHIYNPLFEGVPFVLGPLAATTAALTVFAVMPAPTIDGAIRRRGANLAPRRVSDYSSARQRAAFFALLGVTTAVIAGAGFTSKAAPDGRWLCAAAFQAECKPGGPYLYPGWLFGAPALALIAVLVGAMLLALRRVIATPAAAWPELNDTDAALRTTAVRLVIRFGTVPLIVTLGLFLGAAGLPLLNAPVFETGLSGEGNKNAHLVGIVLVGTSAPVLVYGLVLAFVTALASVRLPRSAAKASRAAAA